MRCAVHRVPITAPDDVAGVRALVERGELAPEDVVAVLGKTEGNGCVNDYSRALAVRQLRDLFTGFVGEERARRILYIMSGGTEGVLCPPDNVDPEIKAPTPDIGVTPVIPPPGSPGGDPALRPR